MVIKKIRIENNFSLLFLFVFSHTDTEIYMFMTVEFWKVRIRNVPEKENI